MTDPSRLGTATLDDRAPETAGRGTGTGWRVPAVDTPSGPPGVLPPDGPDDPPVDQARGRVVHVPDVSPRRVAAVLLLGVSALVLLFLVYLWGFTPVTAGRNQHRLAASLSGQPALRYGLAAGTVPPEGSPIGILTIASLGLHQVVVEGTAASDLMSGPGLLPSSHLPGSPGNSVIAGRRVTFGGPFRSIGTLHKGDRITVVDGAGTFTYRVRTTAVVTAGRHDVVGPTADNRLTLITSDSSLVTSGRQVVVAGLVGRPYAVPGAAVSVPGYELGLDGDPAAGGLALLWSMGSVAVLLAAGLVAWRWRRPWLVYLFATPVFLACGLFACQSLARALPATF